MDYPITRAILTDVVTRSPLLITFGETTVIRPAPFAYQAVKDSGQASGGLQSIKPGAEGTQIIIEGIHYYVVESFQEVISLVLGDEQKVTELLNSWTKRNQQTRRAG